MNIEQKGLELAKLKQRSQDTLAGGDIDAWLDLIHQEFRIIKELQEARLEQSVVAAHTRSSSSGGFGTD